MQARFPSCTVEWITDFERTGDVHTVERIRWNGTQCLTESYRYVNQVPLRDSDDALMLNWCELTVTDAQGKVVYKNAWVTTHQISDANVVEMATAGRARWKIENENNNVLKNQGYHFKHNFGHGKQNLSNLIATLILRLRSAQVLLSFLLHTVLGWTDRTYQTVRRLLPSRKTFTSAPLSTSFEHLRALIQCFLFDSWTHLIDVMLEGLGGEVPD